MATAKICTGSTYQIFSGYGRGQLKNAPSSASDPTYDYSDCGKQVDQVASGIKTINTALRNFEASNDFFKSLLSSAQDVAVEASDTMAACETINKIKQFDIRVKNLSGFFNWGFTMGWSYFMDEDSDFHTAVDAVFKADSSGDCETWGRNLGKLLASSLQTYTADETFDKEKESYGSGKGSNWSTMP